MTNPYPQATTALPIDVLIVNFNAGDLVRQSVASVLGSTVPVRVIVSDNGSTDGSLEALQIEFGALPNVFILTNGANLGFAGGINRGLPQLSEGSEWVLFLNPDARVESNTIEQMLSILVEFPRAGMAGCLIRNLDGSEQRGCRRYEPTPLRSLATLVGLNRVLGVGVNMSKESLPETPVLVDAISGSFMLVHRSALAKVGPMDEGYFLHCEDLDWCRRFRESGLDVLFVPQVTIEHVKGASSKTRPFFVEWYKHKGMVRYYRKFFARDYSAPVRWLIDASVWIHFAAVLPVLAVRKWLR